MPDSTAPHPPDSAALYRALGRVVSGVYILTVARDGQSTGMLASWVMQAGFEPPMVSVAVRQGRYVADWLAEGRPFTLNIVAQGHKHLLKHFGRGFEPGQPAFDGVEVLPAANGSPRLAESLGYLECRPVAHVDTADHHIFLAEVTAGVLTSDEHPMVHIRGTGSHY